MQKTNSNSLEHYIQAQTRQSTLDLTPEIGCGCLGSPLGTGGGVKAVEAVSTVDVFPVCSASECLDSSIDHRIEKNKTHQKKDGQDTIIGDLARVPGECSLSAAAFASEAIEPSKKKGLVYSPSDFSPYSQRRV